jgi:hypothetical protein
MNGHAQSRSKRTERSVAKIFALRSVTAKKNTIEFYLDGVVRQVFSLRTMYGSGIP